LILPNRKSNYFYDPTEIAPDKAVMDAGEDDRYHFEASRQDGNPTFCRKVSWATQSFPTCNPMHENNLGVLVNDGEYHVSYLRYVGTNRRHALIPTACHINAVSYLFLDFSSGTPQDVFVFRREGSVSEEFVMKQMRLKRALSARNISDVRKEAVILEHLSSSPHVVDIYGHCGTAILVEHMARDLHAIILGQGIDSQKRLASSIDGAPKTNFTVSEKFRITLEMAEALADLHGFEGGPISNAGTHIDQWMMALDGSIKLYEFNSVFELKWDDEKQKYCDRSGFHGDTYRPPEKISTGQEGETADVFAFGNNVYAMVRNYSSV
jgi:hypothetical protein